MRIDRSLLNWGVFLIALGGVPLAVQQGWADEGIAGDLWRLWPLILVGIGLGLILRWTPVAWLGGAITAATIGIILGAIVAGGFSGFSVACVGVDNGESATTTESDLASASTFDVELELTCGELTVARGTTSTWEVTAVHDPGQPPAIEGAPTRLAVAQADTDGLFLFDQQVRNEWAVELPASAAIGVSTTLNAAEATVDLGSGPWRALNTTLNAADGTFELGAVTTPQEARLNATLNASSATIRLPAGWVSGNITLNASSLELCIPEAAEVRVRLDATLSSDDLGGSGLIERGDAWQSDGFDGATARIDLTLSSTVSSIQVQRQGTCS